MSIEQDISRFIIQTAYGDLSPFSLGIIKDIVLSILGTTFAGKEKQGCNELADYYKKLGGKQEATILVKGGMIPAQNAAFVNGYMARAVDFCDAMPPGLHIGASAVPAAFACAELMCGCSGKQLLTALTVGAKVATGLNLSESQYDGIDPTGICATFASAAIASKLLNLTEVETMNALALAFNKISGSMQSNIDATLAVRCIQGWAAQNGIDCARLAKLGISGPSNFLTGIYGYFHLYGKDELDPHMVSRKLVENSNLNSVIFKKYPSCGLTQGCTDVALDLANNFDLCHESIERIDVDVPAYTFKLVGHLFEMGNNPTVNAQFSIQYCVANALLRGEPKLNHFDDKLVVSFLNSIAIHYLIIRDQDHISI